ncbi:MAG: type II secretion system protein [Sedimentisphaerales bacterium]|nr:type II secretion system protein [Sedimentisphaerales bacterium]
MNRRSSRIVREIRQRLAFTLVELLVVIAIIAMLMAILLPALSKGKQLAGRVRCGSNLRQLAMAWRLYLDENNGDFPRRASNANLYYGGWRGDKDIPDRYLNSYLHLDPNLTSPSEAKVFQCPADRGGMPGAALRRKVFLRIGTSYQTNIFLIGEKKFVFGYWYSPMTADTTALSDGVNARLTGLNRNGISSPSRLLLIGDYGWYNQWKPTDVLTVEEKEIAEWHRREDHHYMAFMDGHTAFLEIRRGIWVDSEYTVLPWEKLYQVARKVQGE